MSWLATLLGKARSIHAEIAALQSYLGTAEEGAPSLTPKQIEAAFANHYAMLDDLYLHQIPFARAAETSDLLLNYRGAAGHPAAREWAGLGTVDRLFGNVRTQVATMTRAVIDSRESEPSAPGISGQKEPELTVHACLPGSYVGFCVPEADAAAPGQAEAMRQSLHNLGRVAQALPEKSAQEQISTAIDDPEVRDATLGAVKKFLPYRDKSIDAIELRGRALDLALPAAIDRKIWQIADRLMVHPVESAERGTFTGHILQIDYELCRFELRWLDDPRLGNIRCAYSAALASACEQAVKRKVEVEGAVDFRRGRPRLVHVESIRLID